MMWFVDWFFMNTELGRELHMLVEIKRNQRINAERRHRRLPV